MATKSRPHHHLAHAVMDPPPTQTPTQTCRHPDGHGHNDEVYEEVVQQINPYYASMNFAIPAPDMPAAHSQFHAAQWQCQPNSMMWMEALQPWPSTGNTAGPVYADWQADASPPWDFQGHNSFANLQDAQSFRAQSPSPTRVDNTFVPPTPQFQQQQQQQQQQYPVSNAWTPGWVEETSPAQAVPEVMPSVEAMPDETTHEPVPVHAPAPIRVAIPSPAHAASPRQQQTPTPTDELPEYAAPVGGVSPLPVPVRVEKRRRAPTPTIAFEEQHATPFFDTAPVLPSATALPPPLPPAVSPTAMGSAAVGRGSPVKAAQGSQTVFKTQSANSKRGHYASDVWERHKPAIQRLYIEEGKPLREVIKTMEMEHKFPATQRMYKARFKQWGFVKNNTEKVVSQILKTKFQRDAAGKLSQFTRNGKDVNLQNYLQRKGMTEYDLVDLSPGAEAGPPLAHVRCRTPPPPDPPGPGPGPGRDLRLPDRLRFQDALVASFRRALLLWRQEERESAFGLQAAALTWRVTDFPHLSSLVEAARLLRAGDASRGVAALNRAFWAMNSGSGYLASMDATPSFYFFFHRQSRCWQDDGRIALAVCKFLAAYAGARHAHHHRHPNHPLFHAFKLMYEVVQKEGAAGLRGLLRGSSGAVADELERSFGRDHWLKDLIWHRCFPEKSKLRHLQLVRGLRDHGPTRKIVRRLY